MNFNPPRSRGPLALGLIAVAALAFGVALIVHGLSLPVSFGAYLALTLGVLLLAGAAPLGYWAYAAATLCYELRRDGLVIHWGVSEHVVVPAAIERIVLGRHLPAPDVVGLRFPGIAAGRAHVKGVGASAVYARYREAADFLYLVTRDGAYGLALDDPKPFVNALQGAANDTSAAAPARRAASRFGLLADRRALWLALAALVPAWLSGLIVYSRYQRSGAGITAHFPPTEASHLVSRASLLQIPEGALAWFAIAAVAAAVLHQRARAASYLLLGGTVVAGVFFLIGAVAP